jgi:hypothetical protein
LVFDALRIQVFLKFRGLHVWDDRTEPARCSKNSSSKATGESKPEAYPQGYVEDFDEPRTMLAGFFSILRERYL